MVAESELNTGVLLFLPYRALENRVFAALAEAGFDDFTPPRPGSCSASAPTAPG